MMQTKRKLAIVGAAELGKLVFHHAVGEGWEVAGFYDDRMTENTFNGSPVLGTTSDILQHFSEKKFTHLFIAIGYVAMNARISIFNLFKGKIPFANIIHSSCFVDNTCKLGEGIFMLPRTVVDFECSIGDNVLLNTGVVIAHHTTVEDHTFIAPGVHLAGLINVGRACFIGIGASVMDMITIGENSTIGAGSVVIHNTEPNTVSVGVPAKAITKKNS